MYHTKLIKNIENILICMGFDRKIIMMNDLVNKSLYYPIKTDRCDFTFNMMSLIKNYNCINKD